VREGISEGFRLAQSERAVPGGAGAKGSANPPVLNEAGDGDAVDLFVNDAG